jgi:hypothetical protein
MNASRIVEHLRNRGFEVTAEIDGIHVSPGHRLTPEIRELIRANRGRLLEHLRQTAPVDIRDPEFDAALRTGVLVVCQGCQHFEARPGERPDGWCRHHGTEAWARVPFRCAEHEGTA